MPNEVTSHVDFRTPFSFFSDSDKLQRFGRADGRGNIGHKRSQQYNGIRKFIILTRSYPPIEY
jgi:hypothetical protein